MLHSTQSNTKVQPTSLIKSCQLLQDFKAINGGGDFRRHELFFLSHASITPPFIHWAFWTLPKPPSPIFFIISKLANEINSKICRDSDICEFEYLRIASIS